MLFQNNIEKWKLKAKSRQKDNVNILYYTQIFQHGTKTHLIDRSQYYSVIQVSIYQYIVNTTIMHLCHKNLIFDSEKNGNFDCHTKDSVEVNNHTYKTFALHTV